MKNLNKNIKKKLTMTGLATILSFSIPFAHSPVLAVDSTDQPVSENSTGQPGPLVQGYNVAKGTWSELENNMKDNYAAYWITDASVKENPAPDSLYSSVDLWESTKFKTAYDNYFKKQLETRPGLTLIADMQNFYDYFLDVDDEHAKGPKELEEMTKDLEDMYPNLGFLYNLDKIDIKSKKLDIITNNINRALFTVQLNGEFTKEQTDKMRKVIDNSTYEGAFLGNFIIDCNVDTVPELITSLKKVETFLKSYAEKNYPEDFYLKTNLPRIGFTISSPNFSYGSTDPEKNLNTEEIKSYLLKTGLGSQAFIDSLVESPYHAREANK